MRFYNPAGFTDRILEALAFYGTLKAPTGLRSAEYQPFDELPAEGLLALVELMPEAQLEEAQNGGPTIQECVDLALMCREAMFCGFVITKERDDERFTIDCVYLPPGLSPEETPIGPYLPADEDDLEPQLRRLWWD